ncbi:2-polyprenyl-3-methyl-6-methoxy-1,4-benzoquinone monooxygenase [Xanthomonas campestris pv. campestris]|uniref:2-polyprenyl-3-methyl-6-methoxy-1,4-benzoquinone monooxygenase n=1 Tax=Xanthomonas campestris TaxID=339 RepID=UPI001F439445|nr:2-polyprenyl-3-methyl-6-methoxy-1,4-benzoquinone monooxygenase [Xanthomonas campestris]UIU03778.1 2-polyprenyl-3-methyl-6-methoxy-1,4-benzoquinone monooxygenase [Xanthomonas campestris pv. campestris]WVJ84878.1 2-polyprenyl-3-methyl-6-methoxy-1,4-benzoquinone monooxygenase [Xanthomonas campestris pv. campestris]WVL65418.1 2-polyprenyl-3-methyl-6-methoxy-1,4-benzoquinone monooxygenase [Xanthomonas campestris pv. campestris]
MAGSGWQHADRGRESLHDPDPPSRLHSPLDRLLVEAQRALDTVFGNPPAERPNPAGDTPDAALAPAQRQHAAGLMRINHVGEVCAQGLYFGQAAVARDDHTRQHLLTAAQEETDHLAWCADRLRELESRPSLFNPLWYAGSYALGAVAGLRGDDWSLGFVVETERQVEAHLDEHLETLPETDQRSRAILRVMKIDEARHADHAEQAGARILPPPIPSAMALASKLMKTIAYRF